jgi:hypothetical protein
MKKNLSIAILLFVGISCYSVNIFGEENNATKYIHVPHESEKAVMDTLNKTPQTNGLYNPDTLVTNLKKIDGVSDVKKLSDGSVMIYFNNGSSLPVINNRPINPNISSHINDVDRIFLSTPKISNPDSKIFREPKALENGLKTLKGYSCSAIQKDGAVTVQFTDGFRITINRKDNLPHEDDIWPTSTKVVAPPSTPSPIHPLPPLPPAPSH